VDGWTIDGTDIGTLKENAESRYFFP
jgi:hypothetical protein